jgi:hypothetical protein
MTSGETLQKATFSYVAPIHPIQPAMCKEMHVHTEPGHGCTKLYDGMSTLWIPSAASATVEFTFEIPEMVNRMTVHTAEGDSATGDITLTFDGKTQIQAVIGGGVSPQTIEFATQTTKTVSLKVASKQSLSEVFFWHAAETAISSTGTIPTSTQLVEFGGSRGLVPHGKDLAQTGWGFFNAIKVALEKVAMYVCLAAIDIAQGIVSLVKLVVDGIAAVLIAVLEALLAALGPHFFQIIELIVGGEFNALKGNLSIWLSINMWLFDIHIGPWGFDLVLSFSGIVHGLFGKAKHSIPKKARL